MYAQTGKQWQAVSLDLDQPDSFTEMDVEDTLDDEGFEDFGFESNPTIPMLPQQVQHKTSMTSKFCINHFNNKHLISHSNICPLFFLESSDKPRMPSDSEVSTPLDAIPDPNLIDEALLSNETTDEPVSNIATGELKV